MIIEKRALFNIQKNYCKLISFLELNNILFYENETYNEIIIDFREFSDNLKESILNSLFLNDFILLDEKEKIIKENVDCILF
jgi:broad-specificity NMP kinase